MDRVGDEFREDRPDRHVEREQQVVGREGQQRHVCGERRSEPQRITLGPHPEIGNADYRTEGDGRPEPPVARLQEGPRVKALREAIDAAMVVLAREAKENVFTPEEWRARRCAR